MTFDYNLITVQNWLVRLVEFQFSHYFICHVNNNRLSMSHSFISVNYTTLHITARVGNTGHTHPRGTDEISSTLLVNRLLLWMLKNYRLENINFKKIQNKYAKLEFNYTK